MAYTNNLGFQSESLKLWSSCDSDRGCSDARPNTNGQNRIQKWRKCNRFGFSDCRDREIDAQVAAGRDEFDYSVVPGQSHIITWYISSAEPSGVLEFRVVGNPGLPAFSGSSLRNLYHSSARVLWHLRLHCQIVDYDLPAKRPEQT